MGQRRKKGIPIRPPPLIPPFTYFSMISQYGESTVYTSVTVSVTLSMVCVQYCNISALRGVSEPEMGFPKWPWRPSPAIAKKRQISRPLRGHGKMAQGAPLWLGSPETVRDGGFAHRGLFRTSTSVPHAQVLMSQVTCQVLAEPERTLGPALEMGPPLTPAGFPESPGKPGYLSPYPLALCTRTPAKLLRVCED